MVNQGQVEARIQSIGRARALMDAMGSGQWTSLRDLAERTGLLKTTAFNLVNALVDVGLVERDVETGSYRLGMQNLIYGRAVERRLDILSIAKPHLVRICAETRETVNLALPGPTEATIVESLEGTQTLRVSSYAGTPASYHATACGRALLAFQPEGFRRLIYSLGPLPKLTDATITGPDELEAVLASCRDKGWVLEREENEVGSTCIAAPIFDPAGKAVAAVSVAGPTARFQPQAIEDLAVLLIARLADVTADLARTGMALPVARK